MTILKYITTFVAICLTFCNAVVPNAVKVVPAVLGSSVTLVCGIRQTNGLVWDHVYNNNQTIIAFKGDIQIPNKMNQTKFFVQVNGDIQSLIVSSLTLQDDGTYNCWDVSTNLYRESFKVNILVEPQRIELFRLPVNGIDEGTDQTLTCEADGGKPPPIFDWYILGPTKNRTTIPSALSDTTYPNGTGLRRSQIVLRVDRTMYKASVLCVTELPYYFVVNNTVYLDVNLLPGDPTFRNFDGIFDDGQTKSITCDSDGSRPAANITWFIDDKQIGGEITSQLTNTDGTYFVTSTITRYFDKSMDGSNLTCRAMNAVLQRQNRKPLENTIVIKAAYMPILNAMNGSVDAYENSQIIIDCNVDARPMSLPGQVVWLKDGKNIVTDNRIQTDYSTLQGQFDLNIRQLNRFDMGVYQCQASNRLGIGRSPPLALNVFYRPVCLTSSIEKEAASIGQTITLACRVSANPTNCSITWRYKTRNQIIKENEPSFTDPYIDKTSISSIQIKIQSDTDYTDVECIARNNVGTILQPCLYMIVKPGPPETPKNCSSSLVDNDKLLIQCMAGFSGGGGQYFILQRVQGMAFYEVDNRTEPVFDVSNLVPGQNYTYRVCAASLTYSGTVSCSYILSVKTNDDNKSTRQDPVTNAETQDTTVYIIGGVGGFFALLCIVIVILCIMKRRQQIKRPHMTNSEDVVIRSKNKTEIFDKDYDILNGHLVERTHDNVSRQPRDNSQFYLDCEKVAKLEDHPHSTENEDHKHLKSSQTPGGNTQDVHTDSVYLDGPMTTLQRTTLKSIACTNEVMRGTDGQTIAKQGQVDVMHQKGKGINPEVIYTVPMKMKREGENGYHNDAFVIEDVTDLDDSIKSCSVRSQKNEHSRGALNYSDSDINKALEVFHSDHRDLASVTKSLRKSNSLTTLKVEPSAEGDIHKLRCSVYYERNKHSSSTDEIPDENIRARRNTYIKDENDDESKNQNRRRSYSIAIMADARNSANVVQSDEIEDDEVFIQPGADGLYTSIESLQETHMNATNSGPKLSEIKDALIKNSHADTTSNTRDTEGLQSVHNNINEYNVEKNLKCKDIYGIVNAADNNGNGSQDVMAYF